MGGQGPYPALGMAQEEIGYAVAIPSWRFKAAGRGVHKTAALSTGLACSHGHFRSSGQAQEEVMTLDALRFIAAQDAVYSTVTHELEAGQKATHWIWFIFPQLIGIGRSEKAR